MKYKVGRDGNLVRKRKEIPITEIGPTIEFMCTGTRGGAKIFISGVEKDLLSFSVNWDNGRGRVVYTELEMEADDGS